MRSRFSCDPSKKLPSLSTKGVVAALLVFVLCNLNREFRLHPARRTDGSTECNHPGLFRQQADVINHQRRRPQKKQDAIYLLMIKLW